MWLLSSRILAALLGGYACTWGITSLGIAGLVFLGVDFHDAEASMFMLAFLCFLGLFLWAFTVTSVTRVWLSLLGSAALMTVAAWLLQRSVLS
jgi:hypothetical protein